MIQIVLRDDNKDEWLSLSKSKQLVKDFWLYCHKDCCGIVDWQQMENHFTEMHEEFDENATEIDTMEFTWVDFSWDIVR